MVGNVKLRQIIANIYFLRIFQRKKNFWENLTSGCHGNTFLGVTPKSTNPAKVTHLVSMETGSHDNPHEIQQTQKRNLLATSYKKQL